MRRKNKKEPNTKTHYKNMNFDDKSIHSSRDD